MAVQHVGINHRYNVIHETLRPQITMETVWISLVERIHRKDQGTTSDQIVIDLPIWKHPDEVSGGVEAGIGTIMTEIEITEGDPNIDVGRWIMMTDDLTIEDMIQIVTTIVRLITTNLIVVTNTMITTDTVTERDGATGTMTPTEKWTISNGAWLT